MGIMAPQITSLTIVYSVVYSGADQRKHQSSASLAFVAGEFLAQMASNAENVSIWWRHHGVHIGDGAWLVSLYAHRTWIMGLVPNTTRASPSEQIYETTIPSLSNNIVNNIFTGKYSPFK